MDIHCQVIHKGGNAFLTLPVTATTQRCSTPTVLLTTMFSIETTAGIGTNVVIQEGANRFALRVDEPPFCSFHGPTSKKTFLLVRENVFAIVFFDKPRVELDAPPADLPPEPHHIFVFDFPDPLGGANLPAPSDQGAVVFLFCPSTIRLFTASTRTRRWKEMELPKLGSYTSSVWSTETKGGFVLDYLTSDPYRFAPEFTHLVSVRVTFDETGCASAKTQIAGENGASCNDRGRLQRWLPTERRLACLTWSKTSASTFSCEFEVWRWPENENKLLPEVSSSGKLKRLSFLTLRPPDRLHSVGNDLFVVRTRREREFFSVVLDWKLGTTPSFDPKSQKLLEQLDRDWIDGVATVLLRTHPLKLCRLEFHRIRDHPFVDAHACGIAASLRDLTDVQKTVFLSVLKQKLLRPNASSEDHLLQNTFSENRPGVESREE